MFDGQKVFFIIKTKSILFTTVLIFFTIFQILNEKFYVFGRKHFEAGLSCSHKVTTFFKSIISS